VAKLLDFCKARTLLQSSGHLRESQVRLDDDIQPARSHEAVSARECQAEFVHDLGNADGRGTGNAHATVHQSGCTIAAASFCRFEWLVRTQRSRMETISHQ
jgi:hypothetical protein